MFTLTMYDLVAVCGVSMCDSPPHTLVPHPPGVGGGMLADRLAPQGQRAWVTVGASLMAAPLIWASVTAPSSEASFAALGAGFALSEAWRAPSAVMARSCVAPHLASTAISLYLCLRNLVGGLGPLAIAQLAQQWDLQRALQTLPLMYALSAGLFFLAERLAAVPQQQEEQVLGQQEQQQGEGQGSAGVVGGSGARAG
ncbi:hypothetical protein V8C86DRAFT_566079 [Haematococcus lacustris]